MFAVQCPNPKCRKYMLVEDRDRNNLVACLLCKTMIKVAIGPSNNEMIHHASPLRFFDWASPALTRANVPQPTA